MKKSGYLAGLLAGAALFVEQGYAGLCVSPERKPPITMVYNGTGGLCSRRNAARRPATNLVDFSRSLVAEDAGGVDIALLDSRGREIGTFNYEEHCRDGDPAISIRYLPSQMSAEERELFRSPHRETLDTAVVYGWVTEHDQDSFESEGFDNKLIVRNPYSESNSPTLCKRMQHAGGLRLTLTADDGRIRREYQKKVEVER